MPLLPTDTHEHPRVARAVQTLIALNVVVAVLQILVRPEDMFPVLGFSLAPLADGRHWWTVVTYMFVHGGLWHMLGNMYALWLFGPRLEQEWGTRRFAWFYFLSGLGGLVVHALFVRQGVLVGASAAVFGVMAAYAMQWPRDEVHLFGQVPIRLWTLVALLVAINLALGLYGLPVGGGASGGTNVAYLAHLGGLVVAWLYMRAPPAASIDQIRQRISPVPDLEEPPRAIPRTLPRSRERLEEVDEIVAKSKAVAAKRPVAAAPVAHRREESENEVVNRVLDKISAHGLDSLTDEERQVLEEMSRRLRDR